VSDVFVSYKREDEVRVARIVMALEQAGLDVWWDKGLSGGESWRSNIETALSDARCVIVVWSRGSVAPEGHFVRDEAGRALARGILVPVLIDKVPLPVGFGEIQAIDLSHWRGSRRDPFMQDLVATVRAKLDGAPAPKPHGPTARIHRRLAVSTASGFGVTLAAAIATFWINAGGIASNVCTASSMQPALSDGCGMLGVGGRPSRQERLLWQARRPGSCGDLRDYIDRYHSGGTYLNEANALLAARRVTTHDNFVPGTRTLALYVSSQDGEGAPSEAVARTQALARGQIAAERLCKGFAATTMYRLRSATPNPETWTCDKIAGRVSCGFDGQAICSLEVRNTVERETCGQT
jgi:hypothetical protein